LFIGGGNQLASLRAEVERRELEAIVMFRPYQPIELLSHSLAAADVHLVCLQPALEGLIVPSKFYGITASARPCIFIGDKTGEIAQLLARSASGYTVSTGDSKSLAEHLRLLRRDSSLANDLGLRGRAAHERCFSRSTAVRKWGALLDEIAKG
jgi:colanic acid biosynthesis glycosyl transferase WcaI